MAGETPGASNAGRRRKLNWNDDKSTNKVYASGDISALGAQSAADSPRRTGELPVAVATPRQKADDKSADKYYANGGSDRVRGPAAARAQKLGPAPKLGVQPKAAKRPGVITSKDEINPVLEAVVDRLKGGDRPVVVYVQKGNNQVLKRTRAALDLLVTRETITEDEYRDVRLSYEPDAPAQAAIAEKLGAPTATTTVKTEDNEAAGDPLAFLNSDEGDDPKVDVEAVAPVAVDTTGDPAPAEADDDDGADNDFLAAKPEGDVAAQLEERLAAEQAFTPDAAEVTGYPTTDKAEAPADEPAAEAPAPEAAAEEAPAKTEEPTQPRRGKRSGRGAN